MKIKEIRSMYGISGTRVIMSWLVVFPCELLIRVKYLILKIKNGEIMYWTESQAYDVYFMWM